MNEKTTKQTTGDKSSRESLANEDESKMGKKKSEDPLKTRSMV